AAAPGPDLTAGGGVRLPVPEPFQDDPAHRRPDRGGVEGEAEGRRPAGAGEEDRDDDQPAGGVEGDDGHRGRTTSSGIGPVYKSAMLNGFGSASHARSTSSLFGL